MTTDFLESLGHLALGSRLKRAGTLLQSATHVWLREVGYDVPAGHVPLLAVLDEAEPASLGTLVDALGIAQPGVSRMVRNLEAAGWITTATKMKDRRVRRFVLTSEGRQLVDEAKTILWPVVREAVEEMCSELTGPLTEQLEGLEMKLSTGEFGDALATKSHNLGNRT